MGDRFKKNTHQSRFDTVAERATRWIGSGQSILVHTALFAVCFVLGFMGLEWNSILLVLTTIVSLEAIYLAIFIQITVNRNTESLQEVEGDIDEIQENIDELEEHVDDIKDDVEVEQTEEDMEKRIQEETQQRLEKIQNSLHSLMQDFEKLKK